MLQKQQKGAWVGLNAYTDRKNIADFEHQFDASCDSVVDRGIVVVDIQRHARLVGCPVSLSGKWRREPLLQMSIVMVLD
jgi:hypothetical protein